MRKRKKFIQNVSVKGGNSGSIRKDVVRTTGKKEIVEVYNKFYRNQVASLYKAVTKNKD